MKLREMRAEDRPAVLDLLEHSFHLRDLFASDPARAERFGVEAALATCNQIHSANIVQASVNVWREHASCDALWSGQPHTALGIKVADCLPVTIKIGRASCRERV